MHVAPRFLQSIQVRNLLSFGPDTPRLDLEPLNLLIGPNGSGKSNLIDAISLLHAAPGNLLEPIRGSGGIREWLWKGGNAGDASLEVTCSHPEGDQTALRHRIRFGEVGQRMELLDEAIENESPESGMADVDFYYRYQQGRPVLNVKSKRRELKRETLLPDQSVLSQRKDPDQYPEITYLGNQYAKLRFFREGNVGRGAPARRPQPTDAAANYLSEDFSNLALVLNELEHRPGLRSQLIEKLRDADASIESFSAYIRGGTIQLFLHYQGLGSPVPATRLSDGTFRYLCLLAILYHPEPPPLVCLEEPELGLHPDLLPGLADALKDASRRMQLIVTTHSDALVDAFTNSPSAVIVCEKHEGATQMRRLSTSELTKWLDNYGLGQVWRKGEIGGTRW
jgi:predicted ATPase